MMQNTSIVSRYFEIENRFKNSLRYVSLNKENLGTFSTEFEELLLTIGDEISSLMTMIFAPCKKNINIGDFYGFLKNNCNYLLLKKRVIIRDIIVTPWSTDLSEKISTPKWWRIYNKLKHDKYNETRAYRKQATLENVVFAICAYYCLVNCITQKSYCGMNSLSVLLDKEDNIQPCHFYCGTTVTSNLICSLDNKNKFKYQELYYLNEKQAIDSERILSLGDYL